MKPKGRNDKKITNIKLPRRVDNLAWNKWKVIANSFRFHFCLIIPGWRNRFLLPKVERRKPTCLDGGDSTNPRWQSKAADDSRVYSGLKRWHGRPHQGNYEGWTYRQICRVFFFCHDHFLSFFFEGCSCFDGSFIP